MYPFQEIDQLSFLRLIELILDLFDISMVKVYMDYYVYKGHFQYQIKLEQKKNMKNVLDSLIN